MEKNILHTVKVWIEENAKRLSLNKDPKLEEKTIVVSVRFSRKQMTPIIVKVPLGSRVTNLVEYIVDTGILCGVQHKDIDSIRFRGKTIDWALDVADLVGKDYDYNKEVFKFVVYGKAADPVGVYYDFWH